MIREQMQVFETMVTVHQQQQRNLTASELWILKRMLGNVLDCYSGNLNTIIRAGQTTFFVPLFLMKHSDLNHPH